MTNAPRLNMRRPVGADAFHIAADLQSIVDPLDNAAIDQQGTLAGRPAANAVPQGTYYFATDEGVVYRSDGTTWTAVTTANAAIDLSGTFAARPAASAVADGTYYFATDRGEVSRSNGTTWFTVTPGARSAFMAHRPGSTQSIGSLATTKVIFDTEDHDLGGDYDTALSRFTAPVKGVYEFHTGVSLNVTAAESYAVKLYKNGAYYVWLGSATGTQWVADSAQFQLSAGDYVEVYVQNAVAASRNVYSVAERTPMFSGKLIAQVP